jgi:hypothetical protein
MIPIRPALLLLALAGAAGAHSVSLSTGELAIDGLVGRYRLRLPAYELRHVSEAERVLLGAVEIAGARLAERRCFDDGYSHVCEGRFVFAAEPEDIQVTTRLHEVVVSNHVHILHARKGALLGQIVLDAKSPRGRIQFRPAGVLESAVRARPLLVVTALLAACALAVAPNPAALAAFLAGAFAGAFFPFTITPGFGEALLAVAAAYIAFEAAWTAGSPFRWAAAGILGLCWSLYAAGTILSATSRAGAAAVLAAAGFAISFGTRRTRVAPKILLGAALAWFAVSLF